MVFRLSAVTLLCFLVSTALINAAPVQLKQLHKVALRKIPITRDNEHPIMAFQRHQNSAHGYAKTMCSAGREIPDPQVFQERTLARRQMLEDMGELEKRMWFPPFKSDTEAASTSDGTSEAVVDLDAAAPHKAVANGKWRVSASTVAAVAAAAITIAASGNNANGFSKTAVAALQDNTVTNSTSALIAGGESYLIEANDIGYLVEIEMGTPAQTYLLLADTGSGDTWVPSSACTQCGQHTAIGADVSSTFQATTTPFSVTYGSGAVAGTVCSDTMSIAGMTLAKQQFGVATQESVQFSSNSVPFDGLMGLSFSALSQQGGPTPIEALQSSGQVKNAILGIALGRITDVENNGELVFGAADTSKLDSATTQTLAVSNTLGFWQVPMAAATVNGVSTSTNRQAILDTGTSLIVAPQADATAFHAQIQGAKAMTGGMFTIPCTTDAAVTLNFGNAAFQIDARDLIFQPAGNSLMGQCISSVSAGTVTDDQTWLLGDVFLKNVYMTTNVQTRSVDLSARTDAPGSSSFGVTSGSAAAAITNQTATTSSTGQKNQTLKMTGGAKGKHGRLSSGSLLATGAVTVSLAYATSL